MEKRKRTFIVIAVVILLAAAGMLGWMTYSVRTQHAKYTAIAKGMAYEEVVRLMGLPDNDYSDSRYFGALYWDDVLLPSTEQELVRRTIMFRVMPGVFYGFDFDSNGLVIGKHWYD